VREGGNSNLPGEEKDTPPSLPPTERKGGVAGVSIWERRNLRKERTARISACMSRTAVLEEEVESGESGGGSSSRNLLPTPKERTVNSSVKLSWERIEERHIWPEVEEVEDSEEWYAAMAAVATRSANAVVEVRAFSLDRILAPVLLA